VAVLSITDDGFVLDDQPFRIVSGALHYFRVHPAQWSDRLRKARLMGLNTIDTYVPWNLHERRPGEFDFDGMLDLARFLDLAADEGLHVLLRPGPYICGEWEGGGLPSWLLADSDLELRSTDPMYLQAVEGYLDALMPIVLPRLGTHGGPIIAVQVENEYGAYGSDTPYLERLSEALTSRGIDVPLFTSDQPNDLADGALPGVLATANFGGKVTASLAALRAQQPTGPLMCAEFWNGWFDYWGGIHSLRSAEDAGNALDELLEAGASVNFYMFHGGTNFGLTNGANDKGRYASIVTSYDYDAPLDEAGSPTEKYFAFREVIARYAPVPAETPAADGDAPAITVELHSGGEWMPPPDPSSTRYEQPPTFDELGHLGALLRCDVDLPEMARPQVLELGELRDVAWLSVDGGPAQRLSRSRYDRSAVVHPGRVLTLLVEDQGRVNYGSRIGEPKGIIGPVRLGGELLTGWRVSPIDLTERAHEVEQRERLLQPVPPGRPIAGPVSLTGEFTLDTQADLFLDTSGWATGYAFINGFHLGRYRSDGPQRTLYVPAPVTIAGPNRIVILELEAAIEPVARFVPRPDLGHVEE
jgi:beta-galactosidase